MAGNRRLSRTYILANAQATALVLVMFGTAAASEVQALFDEGMVAARAGNFAVAKEHWEPLAEAGHAQSQYNLGLMYERGAGVKQDFVAAYLLYFSAAEQNHAFAQYRSGLALQRGRGVDIDLVAAFGRFALAAEKGVACAAFELGYAYHEGEGVKIDLPEALRWFWISARLGCSDAVPARNYTEREVMPQQAVAAEKAASRWLIARPELAR